jgi:hypothetical protein
MQRMCRAKRRLNGRSVIREIEMDFLGFSLLTIVRNPSLIKAIEGLHRHLVVNPAQP